MEHVDETPIAPEQQQLVVDESVDEVKVGEFIGQCKWFNDVYGYGFLTIQAGADKGKDIFVHHTGITPLNSMYKTLKKGEYVNFNIINGENGLQAVNVTGIGGGSLMCDVLPSVRKYVPGSQPVAPMPGQQSRPTRANSASQQGFIPVHYGKQRYTGGSSGMDRRAYSARRASPNGHPAAIRV